MKLQHLLLSLLCLFVMTSCGSKTETKSGETNSDSTAAEGDAVEKEAGRTGTEVYYVYAKTGLVLRDNPDPKGAKLAT